MPRQKKVLVITYYWPPSGGAGVQRWLKFVKYLRTYGWEPVVYTPLNPESPVIDHSLAADVPPGIAILKTRIWEPYRLYKKFVGRREEDRINSAFLSEGKPAGLAERFSVWLRGNAFIPDARRHWIKPSIRFLDTWLSANSVDAMVSTGPPHSMHLIALGLKEKHALPWLADFRDPWTGIDYYRDLMLSSAADRRHRQLEKRVLSQADAVVAVGNTMCEELAALVDEKPGSRFFVITNGYDDSDVPQTPEKPDGKFTLVHTGSLVRSRNHDAFWQTLSRLCDEEKGFRDDVVVRLVGKTDYSATESIKRHGLERHIERTDYIPHAEISALMQRAQVLLLLLNNTPNARGILTGKLFEYLAARRPVFCVGPVDGDTAAILSETGAGKTAAFDDNAGMHQILVSMYRQFKTGALSVASVDTRQFARKALTQKLAGILDTIARQPAERPVK